MAVQELLKVYSHQILYLLSDTKVSPVKFKVKFKVNKLSHM